MQYPLCRHIMTNGTQCEAPALKEEQWCFFHSRLHQRHHRFRPIPTVTDSITRIQPVHLSALEDLESIQVALSVVINALASGQMETRQATGLLYGLQIASTNVVRLSPKPSPPKVVVTAEPTPDGHYLAEPGAVYEIDDRIDDLIDDIPEPGSPETDSKTRTRDEESEEEYFQDTGIDRSDFHVVNAGGPIPSSPPPHNG